MPTAALSAGHSQRVPGSSSIFGREELVARDFVSRVARFFRQAGWDVVDCSDNVGTTKTDVWSNCANNHLRVNSDFDATFHLNCFNGTANGTEVLYHPSYGNYGKCESLGRTVANAFGTKFRGVQSRPDLGWLNKTKTDFYFELLFVDNESDMQKYNQNADKAAKALVEAVTGKIIEGGGSSQIAGDDSIKKSGIGIAVSKYPDGYGVNLYENPANPQFTGRITDRTPYLILQRHWSENPEEEMINLGSDKQWAYNKHFDVQWFHAYTKYWPGYQIRCFDGPNGNDVGHVDGSQSYQLYNRQGGYIDIGGNRWIKEEHVIIK